MIRNKGDKMNKVLKYIIIFIVTVSILFFSLVLSAMIPRSAIEKNIKESLIFYKKHMGIERIIPNRVDTYIHYYADTRKLNILYNMDSDHPIESVLWDKYYQVLYMDVNRDFITTVEKNKEPNINYLRYWNGCILFLRPLLTIFKMDTIYLINKILLGILALILLVLLFLRSKKLAIIYLLSLIATTSWYASYCIEYSVMFYVMFITSIVTLLIDKKNTNKSQKEIDSKLFILFFITGIITTFFYFLTTELLTIFIPILFIIIIRKEENRLGNLKSIIVFVLKAVIIWFLGYSLMWLAKWVLSSLILHINAFDYVKRNVALRINGLQGLTSYEILYKNVIPRNVFAISFIYYIKENINKWQVLYMLFVVIGLILVFINWKDLKNKKYLLILFLIGLIPYARYLILANHSYRHVMFSFRDQIITLVVLMYIMVDTFNKDLLTKKIEISFKKNKKVGK